MSNLNECNGYLCLDYTVVIHGRKGWLVHNAKVVAYLEMRSAGICVFNTHEPIALTHPIAAPAATPPKTVI
jgi:hypothetical protein